jgi:hypothetical protein
MNAVSMFFFDQAVNPGEIIRNFIVQEELTLKQIKNSLFYNSHFKRNAKLRLEWDVC